MNNKIIKNIQVEISENEIVNISKSRLETKKHIEIIDYHIERLYYGNKIKNEDFYNIRECLKSIKR